MRCSICRHAGYRSANRLEAVEAELVVISEVVVEAVEAELVVIDIPVHPRDPPLDVLHDFTRSPSHP
jgi:hypothetical protein